MRFMVKCWSSRDLLGKDSPWFCAAVATISWDLEMVCSDFYFVFGLSYAQHKHEVPSWKIRSSSFCRVYFCKRSMVGRCYMVIRSHSPNLIHFVQRIGMSCFWSRATLPLLGFCYVLQNWMFQIFHFKSSCFRVRFSSRLHRCDSQLLFCLVC